MTRLRTSHNFHQAKESNPETFCIKCGTATIRVCEWCGACNTCHKGVIAERRF